MVIVEYSCESGHRFSYGHARIHEYYMEFLYYYNDENSVTFAIAERIPQPCTSPKMYSDKNVSTCVEAYIRLEKAFSHNIPKSISKERISREIW
jgi:hypothetical protein